MEEAAGFFWLFVMIFAGIAGVAVVMTYWSVVWKVGLLVLIALVVLGTLYRVARWSSRALFGRD